jgi:hypothetical protein
MVLAKTLKANQAFISSRNTLEKTAPLRETTVAAF